MTPPVRFGIIACSGVAKRWFLPALRSAQNASLVRIGSRDSAKAKQYADEFSCPKYGSYEEVLEDSEVDAVYISTPPLLHKQWVERAARSGKHILCEKPAFQDFATASELVQVCRDSGVRLAENYMFRFHPQHAKVGEIIRSGRIGTPLHFCGEFTYPLPSETDIRLNPELGGGVFHDSAGYPVAAALLQISSKPVSVFCKQGWTGGVDSSCKILLSFQGGETAQTVVALGAFYRSRYSVLGTKGRIEVFRAYSVAAHMQTTITVETDSGEERVEIKPANQFQLQLEDFCDEVTKRPTHPGNMESEMLLRHAIMDAAHRSSLEKREIELSDYNL